MPTPLDHSHASLVLRLVKPGGIIADELSGVDAHLLHMAIGIAGEAGELLDVIKKHAIYRKPLDFPHLIEELGDLEFYMAGLRDALAISRETTLLENIKKLEKRYASGAYSDQQAQARADKQGEQAS